MFFKVADRRKRQSYVFFFSKVELFITDRAPPGNCLQFLMTGALEFRLSDTRHEKL